MNRLRNRLRRLTREGGRRSVLVVLISLVLVATATTGLVLWSSARTPVPGTTVVSLTFDDSTADQMQAAEILDRHGLKGTFFTISGDVDTPGHLTRRDLVALERDGHEIGGHTVLHADLAQLDPAERRREVCIDRRTLQDWGLHPTSFAYPYGSRQEPSLTTLVRDCGYSSARDLGNLESVKGCAGCAPAESLPPADPYRIRTPAAVDQSWTLDDLRAQVVNAQRAGGGWVPLVFERVCDGCSAVSVRPDVLDAFTRWLADSASAAITVRTMSEVVRAEDLSTPTIPLGIPNATTLHQAFTVGPNGQPSCWTLSQNGQNDAALTVTPAGDDGRPALTLAVNSFVNGDAEVVPTMDLGACSLWVQPGTTYTLGARYRSDATPQFVLYTRGPTGGWSYWTSGPLMDASADWRAAQWTTPPTPAGTTGLSWGLGLASGGTVSVVQFGMVADNPPPLTAPTEDADATAIGLWGIVACLLLVLGLWWLVGGRITRWAAGRYAGASAGPSASTEPSTPPVPQEPDRVVGTDLGVALSTTPSRT